MEGNIVKNQIVTLDEPLSNEALLKLNMLLNTSLNGTSLEQINLGVIRKTERTGRDPQWCDEQCPGCSSECDPAG